MICLLRRLALPAVIALLVTTPASMALAAEDAARVIVKFKAGSALMRAQAQSATPRRVEHALSLGQRIGRTLHDGPGLSNRTQVVLANGLSSAQLAARLAKEPDVEYAVVDQKRFRLAPPNDPLYGDNLSGYTPTAGQWYLRAPAGTIQSSIDVESAWGITQGSTSVVVAVLDTGIRYDHPDLSANLLPGYDMVTNVGMANDGNGRDADASDPGDWITYAETSGSGQFAGCGRDANNNLAAENSTWHGTQTTGVIGALTDNGTGMASVGRQVRILPVRVLGKCGGYDSDIMAGMLWAAGISVSGVPANPNPAKVINLSLGGSGACSQAYRDTLTQLTALGVTVVASAGNSGLSVTVPANCPGVIGVAGLRHAGTKVGYSDLGPEITLSAPAGNCVNVLSGQPCLYPILTTSNAGTTTPIAASAIYTNSYYTSLGTSFSAPLVAGTIGLMLSVDPTLTPTAIRAILMGSARAFPTTGGDNGDGGSTTVPRCVAPSSAEQAQCYCTTATCGAGMLDAGAALAATSAGLQAQIDYSTTGAVPSQALTISGASSWVASGRSIASYQWTLVDGGGIVTPLTSTNGSSISVTPSAVGRFTVSLTITDDLSGTSTTVQTIDVVTPTAVTTASSSGGGGGGAMDGNALLGLLAALMGALAMVRRARPQASPKG
ncbi:MAG: S8 family serine peptidase [Aquabacterium sp.]|uniref:S8 family serine peptidase n=1 Tax=Aquabacterium sp. TaxID=1872578 RepID=UPI002716FA19|nr:S8 family serine peptidase [Aquabacterium sp.]MDO9005560.1 S8 family serine peptidase [Aquabacterium sp.]